MQRYHHIAGQYPRTRHGDALNNFLPLHRFGAALPDEPVFEDDLLFQQQRELSRILESGMSYNDAFAALQRSTLANTAWNIEHWHPAMLETAMQIAEKWKVSLNHRERTDP